MLDVILFSTLYHCHTLTDVIAAVADISRAFGTPIHIGVMDSDTYTLQWIEDGKPINYCLKLTPPLV